MAILKFLAISLSLLDARITTLDGQTAEGVLKTIDADNVVFANDAGESNQMPLDSVMAIALAPPADAASADSLKLSEIVLQDGTVTRVSAVEASADTLTAASDVIGDIKIPRTGVRAVRLQELKPEWQAEWEAFLKRENTKDILVVLKRDGTGLDFLSGVVASVRKEDVPFLLDSDEVPVPRSRVFGVVFSADRNSAVELRGDVEVRLADGSKLKVSHPKLSGDSLQAETSWGQVVMMSPDVISEIDFSGGRLHYLSDLEPLDERYFGLDPADKAWGDLFTADLDTRTGLSSQWRMSRDRFPNSGRPPLSLRGQTYKKGLCIFPKAAIEYALDGKYTRLTALIGVDDEVAFNQRKGQPSTAVELKIEADGQEVLSRLIRATEDPFSVELDMTGITTLSIIVDFGDGNSTCDYLDLADARLMVNNTKEQP